MKTLQVVNKQLEIWVPLIFSLILLIIGYPDAIIYTSVFIVSIVFAKQINEQNKYWFLFLILFILALFVGLRDFGVGTDTNIYIKNYFYQASLFNSLDDLNKFEDHMDLGFLLFSKIATLFSNDPQALLICIEILICFFTFASLLEMNAKGEKLEYSTFLLLWLFSTLNSSMNLMRQYCAISILMYAYSLLINGKWKKATVFQVLAYFFHSSSVVFLPVYVFYWMSFWENSKLRNILTAVSLTVAMILSIGIFKYLPMLADSGLVSELYANRYGSNTNYEAANIFGIGIISMFMIIYYSIYYCKKRNFISNQEAYMMFVVISLCIILRLMAFSVGFLARISLYYYCLMILMVGVLCTNKKFPIFLKFSIYVCILYLWYRECILTTAGETFPYHSSILGI